MTPQLRDRVDAALAAFLDGRSEDMEGIDPDAPTLVEEIRRLLEAGGKRIRPAFCYWGYRAGGGGDDDRIVGAAAAIELLHTMALVHDDLIDGAKERRGVPATPVWFSDRAGESDARGDPAEFGRSAALLVGDLAAVLADRMFLEAGFPPEVLVSGLAVYHQMRERMAAGQYLDMRGASSDLAVARRAAALKGGSYTVEGPLLIGAALAGATAEVRDLLGRYGGPLGEAFQLRDDLEDGEAPRGVTAETVNGLVAEAKAALDPDLVPGDSVDALAGLADQVAM